MAEKLQEYSLTWEVTDEMTAKRIGNAGSQILSTPNMVALMEAAAWNWRNRIWRKGRRRSERRSLPPSGADAGGNEGNSDCKTPQH